MSSERLRWRHVRATTPFRLALPLGAIFLAVLWATLGTIYILTARELSARSDRILRARADALLAAPAAALPARVNAEIAAAPAGISYFALIGRDGERVTGNVAPPPGVPSGRPFSVDARPGRHGPLRVLVMRTGHGEMVVLARDVSQIRDLRARLLLILMASGIGGSALLLAGAVRLSLAPLRRVQALARASHAIAAGDFATRMPIAGRHDELDQFAGTVNQMVDELARVVAQVRTATDAVAHDLRTPLTRVRASISRMRALDGLPVAAGAIVERAVADLDAIADRLAALLRIAELEAGGRRAGLHPVAVPPLLREVFDLWEPVAEERGITFALGPSDPFEVEADRELLVEAIGNLVDNALKFAGRAVTLGATVRPDGPAIEVADDGPGIPVAEHEAVLRRFHRAKGAAGVEGTGLGLSIVGAVMHLHGFALELIDADPGLIARIRPDIAAVKLL